MSTEDVQAAQAATSNPVETVTHETSPTTQEPVSPAAETEQSNSTELKNRDSLLNQEPAPEAEEGTQGEGVDGNTGAKSEEESTESISYENLKLPEGTPEGMEMDKALMEKALPIFKEAKLSEESAQALVDIVAQDRIDQQKALVDGFNKQVEQWVADTKADKEIGGDRLTESLAMGNVAINKFGSPELKGLLDSHGIGNHPEMIRFAANVGRALQEDNPGSRMAPKQEPQDRVSILYPNG